MRKRNICIILILMILLSSYPIFAENLKSEDNLKPAGAISKNNYHAEGMND